MAVNIIDVSKSRLLYGAESEILAYSGIQGDVAYSTDTGNEYTCTANGVNWVNTRGASNGAGRIINDDSVPATRETRFIINSLTIALTDYITTNTATPTVADGSNLVVFNSFTNNPKKVVLTTGTPTGFSDTAATGESGVFGFLFAVNAATAIAAATAINAAVDTGGAHAASPPVQNNNDHSTLVFVPAGVGVFTYRQDTVITSLHGAPIRPVGGAIDAFIMAQLDFYA